MGAATQTDPDEKDWRLTAELHRLDGAPSPGDLLSRLRGANVNGDLAGALGEDVVLTHDGQRLFAYAAAQDTIRQARECIERTLRGEGMSAEILVSHWDTRTDSWRQVEPPPSPAQAQELQAAERAAEKLATQTLVVRVGKEIRPSFEQSMRDWAARLGLELEIVEHPHLLSTQVAFDVRGPARRIQEFSEGLRAEELASIRTERVVQSSPL